MERDDKPSLSLKPIGAGNYTGRTTTLPPRFICQQFVLGRYDAQARDFSQGQKQAQERGRRSGEKRKTAGKGRGPSLGKGPPHDHRGGTEAGNAREVSPPLSLSPCLLRSLGVEGKNRRLLRAHLGSLCRGGEALRASGSPAARPGAAAACRAALLVGQTDLSPPGRRPAFRLLLSFLPSPPPLLPSLDPASRSALKKRGHVPWRGRICVFACVYVCPSVSVSVCVPLARAGAIPVRKASVCRREDNPHPSTSNLHRRPLTK